MAMKTRQCPILTLSNPTGQTAEQISVVNEVVTIIPADNVYVWANDLRRLTHCMETICDKTVFHLCKPGFDDHNGVLIYTTLREYYFGKNDQGAKGTRLAMEAWRIKPSSNTLRQDLVLFEELRTQIEYSGELSLNDKWNNSYLDASSHRRGSIPHSLHPIQVDIQGTHCCSSCSSDMRYLTSQGSACQGISPCQIGITK